MCPAVYFVTHVPGLHRTETFPARDESSRVNPKSLLFLPLLAFWRFGGQSLSLVRDAEG